MIIPKKDLRRPMGTARPPTMSTANRRALEQAMGIGVEHTPDYQLQLSILSTLKLHSLGEGQCTFDVRSNAGEIRVLDSRGRLTAVILKSELEIAIMHALGQMAAA